MCYNRIRDKKGVINIRGITHLTVGTAAGIATAIACHPNNTIVSACVVGATMIGSLYPDIDNSKSMLGRKIKPISYVVNKLFGHRGFIHTPFNLLCLMLLTMFPMFLSNNYEALPIAIGFAVGFASHLFLDSITKGGISFLYPFAKKRFNLTTIKTGGLGEYLVVAFILALSGGVAAITWMTTN